MLFYIQFAEKLNIQYFFFKTKHFLNIEGKRGNNLSGKNGKILRTADLD